MNKSKMCGALLLAAIVSGCGNSNGTAKAPTVGTATRGVMGRKGTFRVTHTLEKAFYNDSVSGFVFSPDGNKVAAFGFGYPNSDGSGNTRGMVFIYDAQTGDFLKRLVYSNALTVFGGAFDRVIWSPDGKYIAAWRLSEGQPTPLFVWDVNTGDVTGQFDTAQWAINTAAWTPSGELLVARQSPQPPRVHHVLVCSRDGGAIRKTIDLGSASVLAIETASSGDPRMLVLTVVAGKPISGEGPYQSSICTWNGDALSAPLLTFPIVDVYIGAAFGKNIVALCGVNQAESDAKARALYALVNTQTQGVVWQKAISPRNFALELWLSPDEMQIWPHSMNYPNHLVLDARTGASSVVLPDDFVFFSPDGKRLLRRLQTAAPGATKPHLPIAELLER